MKRRRLLMGVVTGVAAVAMVEVMRPRGPARPLIDWDGVRVRARARFGDEAEMTAGEAQALATKYNAMAGELRQPLLDLVGDLPPGAAFPPFVALDRLAWVDLNVDIMRRVMEPLLEANVAPASLLLNAGRTSLEAYVGMLLGFLARRVLGQFDPHLLGREALAGELLSTGLYLVEPNIAEFEAEAELPADDLRRWLILHEMTHAWQFSAHPWLQGHINGLLAEVLALAGNGQHSPLQRALTMTFGLPAQVAVMRRMQATMSLVEGYGNLAMNRVGRELLPSFDQMRLAHERRAARRTPLEMLFWRITGLEMKLQQYTRGERFCQAVVDAHGIDALNLAWQSAETLPTLAELDHPETWYARVSAGAAPPPD